MMNSTEAVVFADIGQWWQVAQAISGQHAALM
jgi:hypothetical protein